uniref:Uncharacterized protein n=1 Tax=Siphoviridae sp. ctGa111 TaxID=2825413 RepID=A0A8S5VDX4_9CAUD|nr:MAG TPA: hypothetical protein [Siphoviridae sp. ctGa111]
MKEPRAITPRALPPHTYTKIGRHKFARRIFDMPILS